MIPKLYTVITLPDPLDMFGQLLAQAPFAVWVADRNGRVLLFNEAMRKLVGIDDPEKILAKYSLFEDPIAVSQGLVPYIKQVLSGKVMQTVMMLDLSQEHFGNNKYPKVFYVRCQYFALKDEAGEYQYIVMLVENITQQYLDDLTLSKAAHEMEKFHREVIDREYAMIEMKRRIAALKNQLAELKAGKRKP